MNNVDLDAKKWLNDDTLSYDIWNNKYRVNNESFSEWLDRVSNNDSNIKRLILEKKFLFGGRTLANRHFGTGSYSNCYCSGRVGDSLKDIMRISTNIALTFQAQGGQGLSLTNIRPKGAKVQGVLESDGIIPFLEIFNTITQSISQGSHRRGRLSALKPREPKKIRVCDY